MTAVKKTGRQLGKRWALYLMIGIGLLGLLSWGVIIARDDDDTGIRPASVVSHGGPVKDYVSLIDSLRGQAAAVEPKGDTSQPFLSGSGYMVSVNGQNVQVFEYPNSKSARADADKISSDGSTIGNSMVSWVDTPHFYKKERVIVIYIGRDAKTLDLLTKTLGSQFAGR